ncbi:MAG: ABC transporter transmembrane domain-containing protein [Vampirovibrionales bacterium]|nr:ABC transporter transmembrane domain-containing protein [Vampirovibrionales bacterium]
MLFSPWFLPYPTLFFETLLRIMAILKDIKENLGGATSYKEDLQLYRRLLTLLNPHWKRFSISVAASIPVAAMGGVLTYLSGTLVDELLQHNNIGVLKLVPLVILASALIEGVFTYISNYQSNYVGTSISQSLRKGLFDKLIVEDIQYIFKNTPGDLLSRYYTDPGRVQAAIVDNLQSLILESMSIVAFSVVLLTRSWQLAIAALAIISLIIFPIQIISKKIRTLDFQNQKIAGALYDVFYEAVVGAPVIAVFNLQQAQSKRFDKVLQEFFVNTMRMTRASIVLKPILQAISALGVAGILSVGAILVERHTLTAGQLTSFLIALILLYKPIKNVGGIISKIQRVFAPAERVFEKLGRASTITDGPNPIAVNQFESLTFEDVSYSYQEDASSPVLNHINLTVKPGETIALVGRSGGGKSTFVNLIPRFMDPTGGRLLLNGHDMKDVSLHDLRNLIAMVNQQTVLFRGSLEENVRLGNASATQEQLDKAFEVANLNEMLSMRLSGSDSDAGPGGAYLSGGQRQRVSIARALIKNAPILILDEATSALDNESEAFIQDAFKELSAGKTVFVIAHRLSSVLMADRILVMDKGHIVECGNHNELMALKGLYSHLFELQFRHLNADDTNPYLMNTAALPPLPQPV